jgi:hypothetical protein
MLLVMTRRSFCIRAATALPSLRSHATVTAPLRLDASRSTLVFMTSQFLLEMSSTSEWVVGRALLALAHAPSPWLVLALLVLAALQVTASEKSQHLIVLVSVAFGSMAVLVPTLSAHRMSAATPVTVKAQLPSMALGLQVRQIVALAMPVLLLHRHLVFLM